MSPKQKTSTIVELDPVTTSFTGCECKRGYIPSLSFSIADVGLMLAIEGNKVEVDGRPRSVSWGEAEHSNCTGQIATVDESVNGKITLTNGKAFQNPRDLAQGPLCKSPEPFTLLNHNSGVIQDKAGEARLRKGQSTEFQIRPPEARIIRINILKFKTLQNAATTLELYEGLGVLSRPLEKWSHQKRPEKNEYTVFFGAATLSRVHKTSSFFTVPPFP